jgi:hypothetical protein
MVGVSSASLYFVLTVDSRVNQEQNTRYGCADVVAGVLDHVHVIGDEQASRFSGHFLWIPNPTTIDPPPDPR